MPTPKTQEKIVEAVERRGMKKSEVACLFGVSPSSVKRYVRKFRQGRSGCGDGQLARPQAG